MKVYSYIILFLLCGFLIKSQPLKGTKWILVSMDNLENGKSLQLGAKIKASLHFDSDTTFSGLFCNAYKGHYSISKDHKLSMVVKETNKAMCFGMNAREKELFTHYGNASKYRIEKGLLFIFTSNKQRLTFHKE